MIRPIVIDTREQTPFVIPPQMHFVVAGLKTGDYSLVGLENYVAVERKSLNDLVACIGRERDRFERELARLSLFAVKCVVIEAGLDDIAEHRYAGVLKPQHILGSTIAWQMDLGIPFHWCSNVMCARATMLHTLTRAEERYERDRTLARLGGNVAFAESSMKKAPSKVRV